MKLRHVSPDAAVVFQLPEFVLCIRRLSVVVVFCLNIRRVVGPDVRVAQLSVSVKVPGLRSVCQKGSDPRNFLPVSGFWVKPQEQGD